MQKAYFFLTQEDEKGEKWKVFTCCSHNSHSNSNTAAATCKKTAGGNKISLPLPVPPLGYVVLHTLKQHI